MYFVSLSTVLVSDVICARSHYKNVIFVQMSPKSSSVDMNPIHQLCQPCILVADAVKNTNKSPTVKEAEKKTCNTILKNDLVCNGAVEVAGIYLNWTPSQKICENFQMCASLLDNKKMRAPAKGAKRPDEVTLMVLEAFENDEFPILQSRFARQAQNSVNLLEIPEIRNFEKFIREHNSEIMEAFLKCLTKFQNALNVYVNANPSSV
ncbi:hypothetical protein B9Z55_019539 [Caenorhabditis nigoni]|uniref:Uncharacterized protein n=1 Tax=Caenorhabditis nigoni TaxID=1611254 RepID=A0A2G5TJ00_9PELO|nr:hypothetical protein B9Z55_019539 [Caenorhabditis nigoni]